MGALTPDGWATAVADSLVTADFHLAFDVLTDFTTKVTLDLEVDLDVRTDPGNLGVGQIANTGRWFDSEFGEHRLRRRVADTEDVGERDLCLFVSRNVNTGNQCHVALALPLLVTGIRADHHDATVPLDDLAVITHWFDACSDLHGLRPFFRWIATTTYL